MKNRIVICNLPTPVELNQQFKAETGKERDGTPVKIAEARLKAAKKRDWQREFMVFHNAQGIGLNHVDLC